MVMNGSYHHSGPHAISERSPQVESLWLVFLAKGYVTESVAVFRAEVVQPERLKFDSPVIVVSRNDDQVATNSSGLNGDQRPQKTTET